jgi:glycosyltransferase involved in cell wall biosynthesis
MNGPRLKVVYLLDWFLFYATELSNAMAEEHDVLLIPRVHDLEVSSPEHPMPLREYLDAAVSRKVKLEHIRYRRGDPRSILEVIRLHRLIRRWGADVIHVQETVDWRVVLLAVLNRHRQVVVTIHDIEAHPGDDDYRRPYALLFRLLLRTAKKIIVHGDALRDQLRRRFPIPAGRTEVAALPHGVFSLYRAWDDPSVEEEPWTILFFGRIVEYKGLDDLIDAQPLVSAAIPQARFVVAGEGPFEDYRRRLRDPAAFEIHNRFIPNTEIPRLLRRAALVVLPYREASQSGVIPLAYEFGKPVVATRVGSLPEVVEHGGSGLLVEPRAPQQLAEAIIRVLGDAGLRNRLAAGARRIGQTRLSWKTIAEQTARLYRKPAA